MKHIKKYLSIALLIGQAGMFAGDCCVPAGSSGSNGACCAPVRTSWVNMTIGQNLYTQYHKLLFPEGYENSGMFDSAESDCCSWAIDTSATYRFVKSRNGGAIGSALWGSNNLTFQGADIQAPTRSNNGLIAEYFGLAPDTNAAVNLCPQLNNNVLDFQLAISGEKAWAQVNFPLVWAKWSPTKGCSTPNPAVGKSPLDGAILEMAYKANTVTPDTNPGTINVSGDEEAVVAVAKKGVGTNCWFAEGEGRTQADSLMAAVASFDLTNVNTEDAEYQKADASVTPNLPAMGTFGMGLYGDFSADGPEEGAGAVAAKFEVSEVAPAASMAQALGGYKFGNVKSRNYNNFNFSPCSKFGLADIPVMVGYDFCKSDAWHLGTYIKFVIPTGTKIDQCFLQYVLSPVIGNGRHFELGVGANAHANAWSCDTSSISFFADGYINYMFGTCQTRTFDLPGQPMSRYAMVYPLVSEDGEYSTNDGSIMPVGDANTYTGNVNAYRGEFIFDAVWACRNFEVGLGYAFAGESAQKMNCASCATTGAGKSYAIVGDALQNSIGVGSTADGTGDTADTLTLSLLGTEAAPNTKFYNLGSTGEAAQITSGDNAITSYGEPGDLEDVMFDLPNVQGNCSGLMSGQVLNRIFGHIDYVWTDCSWQPEIGILGSFGFVPAGKPTAAYWDLGGRVGFAF